MFQTNKRLKFDKTWQQKIKKIVNWLFHLKKNNNNKLFLTILFLKKIRVGFMNLMKIIKTLSLSL